VVNNNRLEPAGSKAAMLKLCDVAMPTVKSVCLCVVRSVITEVTETIKPRLYTTAADDDVDDDDRGFIFKLRFTCERH